MFSSQLPNKYLFSTNPSRVGEQANFIGRSASASFDSANCSEYISNSQREIASNPSSQDLFSSNPRSPPKRYSASQDKLFSKPKQFDPPPKIVCVHPEKTVNDPGIEFYSVVSTLMKDILTKISLLTTTLDNALAKISTDLKNNLSQELSKLQTEMGNYYRTFADDVKLSERERSAKEAVECLLKERNETIESMKADVRNAERENQIHTVNSLTRVLEELRETLQEDTVKMIKNNKELIAETIVRLDDHVKAEENLLAEFLKKLTIREKSDFGQICGKQASFNQIVPMCLRSGTAKYAVESMDVETGVKGPSFPAKKGPGRPRKCPKKTDNNKKSKVGKNKAKPTRTAKDPKMMAANVLQTRCLQIVPGDDFQRDVEYFLRDVDLPQLRLEFVPRRESKGKKNNNLNAEEFFM